MALARDSRPCGINWIVHLRAALFFHKPGVFQGIASELFCGQQNLKRWPVLLPLFHCDSRFGFTNVVLAL